MCEKCNPDEEGRRKRELVSLEEVREEASIYVGESARSLQERARDHWSDLKSKNEDSHMYKHWLTSHGNDPEPPEFRIRVVKFCTSALVRQIGEATRILLRKNVLNSGAGYNRSGVARGHSPTLAGWRRQTLPLCWKTKGDKQCPEEQMKWKLKSQLKEEKGRER